MEVSYSILATRCAYRVTHLDCYNLPLTSFHHLAWAVGQLEATVAAHQLPELPKPKSTEVVTIQMGQPCRAHQPPFFLIPFLFHSGSLFCGFPSLLDATIVSP